ncbi:Uncharacterised protein [Salmonella enterica subsp. enterica]|uniref:Uncharacterized protein n=1 Tax=Salmonella enterica I TaxID=59201 RepID=A0A379WQR1_SALET|nr:Uncharacterised protein [Salmonella enterica subsp. enterica]
MIADKPLTPRMRTRMRRLPLVAGGRFQTRARHQTKRLCKLRALYSNTVSGLAGNNLQRAIGAGDPQRRDRNYRAGKRALRIRINSGRPDSEFLRAVIAERAGPGAATARTRLCTVETGLCQSIRPSSGLRRPLICSVRLTLRNRRYIAAFHGGQDAIKQLARA